MTDFQVIASVIRYLQAESGAVSCNVHLPSGKNVVVYVNGNVENAYTKRGFGPYERQIMKDQIIDCLAAIAIGAVFAILLAWRG